MTDSHPVLPPRDSADPLTADQLLPLVYEELRQLARVRLSQERPGHTLQATALVHEAYLRLVAQESAPHNWNSRGHFFGAAAEAMRRILVEQARRKSRRRHGGEFQRVELEEIEITLNEPPIDLLDLNDALTRFESEDPKRAQLVKLRYFAGLSIEEAATILEISPATAKRYWNYARAWLYGQMRAAEASPRNSDSNS